MLITVTGKQVEVGDALRARAEAGLTASVAKYFANPVEAHVTVSREGSGFRVEIAVRVARGVQVQGEAKDADAYAACDVAVEHVAKRLRRHKRRLKDHHKGDKDGVVRMAASYVLAGPLDDDDADGTGSGVSADGQPAVIAEMATEIPTLSVSDAVMRLDLTDAPALLFNHSVHGGLNMVYRRADGNIGWVDPANSGTSIHSPAPIPVSTQAQTTPSASRGSI
jgi:ribosomal subunit interface protein